MCGTTIMCTADLEKDELIPSNRASPHHLPAVVEAGLNTQQLFSVSTRGAREGLHVRTLKSSVPDLNVLGS